MSAMKYRTAAELCRLRTELEQDGKRMVFTNGCFDLLHEGHLLYLKEAAREGDALVVAINSDASVRAIKGPDRPVRNEQKRMEALAALEFVDYVTVFEDDHVSSLMESVRPHLYVKGGDYTIDTINAGLRVMLEKCGIETRFLAHKPGVSTTALLSGMSPEERAKL